MAAIELIDFRFRAQLRSRAASSAAISCPPEERFPTSTETNSMLHYCHNRGRRSWRRWFEAPVFMGHVGNGRRHRPQEKKDGKT